ncbi:hypothetical protein BT93_E1880 [Corymbia citriodora subsp. variegata]|nr:hypothetical protein BT93_E1880 [Corymbia citriodora subsp. variegata]
MALTTLKRKEQLFLRKYTLLIPDKKRTLNCYEGLKNQNQQSASCAFVSILLNNLCKLHLSRDYFFFISIVQMAKENNHQTIYPLSKPMFIRG